MRILSSSEKETAAFARRFAKTLRGGETILLIGDLGAGKTTFTRALARALGIKEKIKSPTFTLLHLHLLPPATRRKTKVHVLRLRRFIHVDAYRTQRAQEFAQIGLLDFIGRPDTVVVIEWGGKIKPLLKKIPTISLTFSHGKSQKDRTIVMSSRP